jgi:hypothetical protein
VRLRCPGISGSPCTQAACVTIQQEIKEIDETSKLRPTGNRYEN